MASLLPTLRGRLQLFRRCLERAATRFRNRRHLHAAIRDPRRPLLVIARHGGLGDLVCLFPSVIELRRRQPDAFVVFVTRDTSIPLVKAARVADLILEWDDPLARQLQHGWRGARWINPVLPDEKQPPEPRPRRHLVAEFAALVGVDSVPHRPQLGADRAIAPQVRAKLHSLAGGKTIALHVGPTWPVKQWPVAHWTTLVADFNRLGFRCVQIGSDVILSYSHAQAPRIAGCKDLVGRLSLAELIALLSEVDLFVGVDSGFFHIASALGTPTLGLFGPTAADCFVHDRPTCVGLVGPTIPCLGCHHLPDGPLHAKETCPHDIRCMPAIEPAHVLARALDLLGTKSAALNPAQPIA